MYQRDIKFIKDSQKLFHKQLMNHLERNGLLFNDQFGFRAKRSTE